MPCWHWILQCLHGSRKWKVWSRFLLIIIRNRLDTGRNCNEGNKIGNNVQNRNVLCMFNLCLVSRTKWLNQNKTFLPIKVKLLFCYLVEVAFFRKEWLEIWNLVSVLYFIKIKNVYFRNIDLCLTYLKLIFPFYIPWKHQQPLVFYVFRKNWKTILTWSGFRWKKSLFRVSLVRIFLHLGKYRSEKLRTRPLFTQWNWH